MRRVFASLLLAGCSGSTNDGTDAAVPDNCPLSTASQVELVEGQGAQDTTWASHPALVPIAGENLPTSELLLASSGGNITLDSSIMTSTFGVIAVSFAIDETIPADDVAIASDEALVLFVPGGECVEIPVRLTFLPELVAASGSFKSESLAPLYSFIEIGNIVGAPSEQPIVLQSASAIVIKGNLDLGGSSPLGGVATPSQGGPGGGSGGAIGASGTFEGGGGVGVGSGGGGGGHVTRGGDGPLNNGSGGAIVGHRTLQRLSAAEHRAGHGGGGCDSNPGGGGGGAIFAEARGPIVVESATIDVRGGGGIGGGANCPGGPGSAGSIFFAGTGLVGDSGANQSLRVEIGGVTGDATIPTTSSGGRLRLDLPDSSRVTVGSSAQSSIYHGALLSQPVTRLKQGGDDFVDLTVLGEDNFDGTATIVSAYARSENLELVVAPPGPAPAMLRFPLRRGLNQLCIVNHIDIGTEPIAEDESLATNCVEVGFVP